MKLKQGKGCNLLFYMAEREGFEPSEGLHPRRFSRPVLSTAQSPLRKAEATGYTIDPGFGKPVLKNGNLSPIFLVKGTNSGIMNLNISLKQEITGNESIR